MRDRISVFTLVLAITACACRSTPTVEPLPTTTAASPSPAPSASPSVTVDPTEGWGGDVLVPAFVVSSASNALTIRARATTLGAAVDLDVVFDAAAHTVELRPTGPGADRLLETIARAWKAPAPKGAMRHVTVPAAWLAGDANATATNKIATKVFFELAGGDAAELYVNWNPSASTLEILEKDEGYREDVLRALTAP